MSNWLHAMAVNGPEKTAELLQSQDDEIERLSHYERITEEFLKGCSCGAPGECKECLDGFISAARELTAKRSSDYE